LATSKSTFIGKLLRRWSFSNGRKLHLYQIPTDERRSEEDWKMKEAIYIKHTEWKKKKEKKKIKRGSRATGRFSATLAENGDRSFRQTGSRWSMREGSIF
jgi:hypothetical protein